MSADQNIETIQSIYEAFGLGDVEVILANVTDEVRRRARAHRRSGKRRPSGIAGRRR
jgi:hypothetical protein